MLNRNCLGFTREYVFFTNKKGKPRQIYTLKIDIDIYFIEIIRNMLLIILSDINATSIFLKIQPSISSVATRIFIIHLLWLISIFKQLL